MSSPGNAWTTFFFASLRCSPFRKKKVAKKNYGLNIQLIIIVTITAQINLYVR
ncbi:hypothetical protein BH10BAC2_BH10BAC2_05230 [soil metagenome]